MISLEKYYENGLLEKATKLQFILFKKQLQY